MAGQAAGGVWMAGFSSFFLHKIYSSIPFHISSSKCTRSLYRLLCPLLARSFRCFGAGNGNESRFERWWDSQRHASKGNVKVPTSLPPTRSTPPPRDSESDQRRHGPSDIGQDFGSGGADDVAAEIPWVDEGTNRVRPSRGSRTGTGKGPG